MASTGDNEAAAAPAVSESSKGTTPTTQQASGSGSKSNLQEALEEVSMHLCSRVKPRKVE